MTQHSVQAFKLSKDCKQLVELLITEQITRKHAQTQEQKIILGDTDRQENVTV